MKQASIVAASVVLAIIALHLFAAPRTPAQRVDAAWTSTREIQSLKVSSDGALWAQTSGGVLRFQNGVWKKWLQTPAEYAALPTAALTWRGRKVESSFDGLRIGDAKTIALPNSPGTHISAVLVRGGVLWVALFGDGVWEWNGARWRKLELKLPHKAREITALAQSRDGKVFWIGTRREGVWEYSGASWKQHLQANEPFAHNIQFLQSFQGALWASTLEDGLVVRDAAGWKHFDKSVLSSNAPRQMVVFQNKLYVRHSNEVVDCFDGKTWRKNVFPALPRRQIISLAADASRLYLGQWGGWSEWDGRSFTHRLKIPDLQIVPLMQILPDGEKVWLGTENRGAFEWNRNSKKLRQHDERDGLPDDWITVLIRNRSTLLAGTFNGGLACREKENAEWKSTPELRGTGITAIVPDGARSTFIGTRFGVYRREESGHLVSLAERLSSREREVQAMLLDKNGLWIGARDGLSFRTRGTTRGTLNSLQ